MRILTESEQRRVASLTELDALVGEMIMRENPSIYWEDAGARYCFDSLDEALDVLHDPILQNFLSGERTKSPVVKVREFRPYSSTMSAAWEVVERLAPEELELRKEGREWSASFGACTEVRSESAALAICLAALRSSGHEVYLDLEDGSCL